MSRDKPQKSRRQEHTEETREALLAAGRDAFVDVGYATASTEAISAAARVTRGAFYHHFDDKRALFDAVVVALEVSACRRIEQKARQKTNHWDSLYAGIDAYLDICVEPAFARLVVRDAEVVLGPERFQEIEEAHTIRLLTASLKALQRQGKIEFDDVELLSRLLDAMICKIAVLLPAAPNAAALKRHGLALIRTLLDGCQKSKRR